MKSISRALWAAALLALTAAVLYLSQRPVALTYHLILEQPYNENEQLFVKPGDFDAQIKWLKENGYTFLFAGEYTHRFRKAVMITLDDGYEDNYTNALPILEKYGAKATVFVATDSVGNPDKMKPDQLRRMAESGLVSLGSHTAAHGDITLLSGPQKEEDLARSERTLYELTGTRPDCVSWPYGKCDLGAMRAAGGRFRFGYATQTPLSLYPFRLRRVTVNRGISPEQFADLVKKG